MAERQPAKGKKRGLAKATALSPETGPGSRSGAPQAARFAELERERNRLAAELEAALAKIAALEQIRDQALNHIDWVIDSLHSLRVE